MFESAELGHKIDDATFDEMAPALRESLLRHSSNYSDKHVSLC